MEKQSFYPLNQVDKTCFGCGSDNENGLKMKFLSDEQSVCSEVVIDQRFCGWSRLVHGGVISAVLDETMGWTVLYLTKQLMLTRKIEVVFKKPVPVGTKVRVSGFIKRFKSKKSVIVAAEMRDEADLLLASSVGEFALIAKETFLRMEIMTEAEMEMMLAAVL